MNRRPLAPLSSPSAAQAVCNVIRYNFRLRLLPFFTYYVKNDDAPRANNLVPFPTESDPVFPVIREIRQERVEVGEDVLRIDFARFGPPECA